MQRHSDRPLSPSEAIVDSQSIATDTMVCEEVGYDAAIYLIIFRLS